MAYDPLTGRYTPDRLKPGTFTYGQGNPLSNVYVPPATVKTPTQTEAPARASLGSFRAAEDRAEEEFYAMYPDYRRPGIDEGGDFFPPEDDQNKNKDDGLADLLTRQEAARLAEEKRRAGQSAYDLLFNEFAQYGLQGLIEPLKQFIQDGISPAEFTLRLRGTDAYKKRFAANQARIQKGLTALSEAEYIGLEDQYQNIMRNYGLPANYYTRGDMGRQEGFEKFIANDVSALELEDRIATAQKRVINANPEVTAALKQFYPDINTGDILAYTLDPETGLETIKRKVTAAEIGGAAIAQGLTTGATRAEELARYGVDKAAAQAGYQTIAGVVPRAGVLADIYKTGPYGQTQAEQEVFGLAGAEEASKQRRKLTELERASFSGSSGAAQGALGRERAMGQGQF
jgi:hypothetical protein